MGKDNIIMELWSLAMLSEQMYDSICTNGFCFFNEKLMGYSVSLSCEIDDLLAEGYTKEEINYFILKSDFASNDSSLTKDEREYLRERALRLLDIRYDLYIKEISKKKTKKEN